MEKTDVQYIYLIMYSHPTDAHTFLFGLVTGGGAGSAAGVEALSGV